MNETGENMDAIFRRYALPLKKFVMTYCHDDFLADDLVAETFYQAIVHIDSFRGGNIFSWLCTIAKNQFLNHVKKKENQNVSLDDEESSFEVPDHRTPADDLLQEEMRELIMKNISQLEPHERDVVYMRIFAESSYKEIGEIMGKTENWARVTYFRSKEKLRKSMERME